MITHQLEQGSQAWHEHRAKYFNASDVPAMLGISKYKTRSELLDEYKTGMTKEVDAATQKRFYEGHRYEALARPIAENIIGEELYPVTGTLGKLGASFDGLTINEQMAFEHKSLNNDIRNCKTASDLHIQYQAQMEQQCLVAGCDKVLFMATSWDLETEILLEKKEFFYQSNPKLRQRIIDGWAQFEKDLENHTPISQAEAPKAQPTLALPALFIHATGGVTTSNMAEYGEALKKRLEEVRSIALVNDQDFSNAKEAAKHLREGIKQAKQAKEAMLAQTVTVGEASRMIDNWCEDMRITALQLEKDVEKEDLAKKQAMIKEAQDNFSIFINSFGDEIPFKHYINQPNFAEAIKGKSKYASMQDAINTLMANSTIEANKSIADLRSKFTWYKTEAKDYEFLFADINSLLNKAADDFELAVKARIDQHNKAMAAKQEIKAEAPQTKPELVIEQTARSAKQETKPSKKELIEAIANHFSVSNEKAYQWLATTDFRTAIAA